MYQTSLASQRSFSHEIHYEHRHPLPQEYNFLRKSAGWEVIDQKLIRKPLERSLFSVCITRRDEIIGMGRIVGDGLLYFYVQDVIVLPEYRGKGIGDLIMEEIMNFIERRATRNSFIGLMAVNDVESFFKKYGFEKRSDQTPGMFRIWRKMMQAY